MKRLLLLAAALLFTLGAAAHTVKDLDIRVELRPDGSAKVIQVWTVSTTSDGTEWYIPVGNLGPMSLKQFQVSENGRNYDNLGDQWDTGRSRSEKAGQCGVVRKNGGALELCWGLGATGDHTWTVSFVLTGLVQGYDDADGFNFMFVNKGMANPPRHVRLTIRPIKGGPKLNYDNTRVWGFGYPGHIEVRDGAVVAETDKAMTGDHSLIALVRFEKGIFSPEVTHPGESFESLKEKALDGSAYGADDQDDTALAWTMIPLLLLVFGGVGVLIVIGIESALGYKYKRKFFGTRKISGWYRDLPLEWNLFAAQFLLQKGRRLGSDGPSSNLIGALFLRWIMDGKLAVLPDPRSDKRVNLQFLADSSLGEPVEEELFQMALTASGENRILEKNEFENWARRHYTKMVDWPDRAVKSGRKWFRDKGFYVSGKNHFTEAGAAEARHLIEMRNFLKDFTLSDERSAREVYLWKEYLVYAQLFGIADRVAKQFKKLYPAEFEELARQTHMHPTTLLYATNWTAHMSAKAFSTASAKAGKADGTGGHASFSGGGGFSGGGFGGGAR